MPELCSWRFSAATNSGGNDDLVKLDLFVNTVVSHGTKVVSVYSPFWMVNKTGKMLTYRGQDQQNVIYHPIEQDGVPMMFSYTAKGFLGKRKASLRIEESSWSDPFSLDTIEDAGKVSCKKGGTGGGKKQSYSVGVTINMSKASLTKIITFTPYYIILNTAEFPISIRELEGAEFVDVPAGECVPFWPTFGANSLIACVTGTPELTPKFSMQAASSSLLVLDNKYGAINVECRLSNSECLLTLSSYSRGMAPVQLINSSKDYTIEYCEGGARTKKSLKPSESVLYTWLDPSGPRKLIWSIDGYTDEYTNALVSDGEGVVELEADKLYLGWVSFLDGMQRVLLFTDDLSVCYSLAHTTGENERIEQEFNISIHGIGISVVNNSPSCSYELLYTSVTSSDIVWEIKRSGKTRYKPLTRAQCDALEEDFQLYQREKSIGKRTSEQRTLKVVNSKDVIVVNYQESKMYQPSEGSIRRQFERGLWLQMR
jgi:vacuolar protein sorting-associated protein 13A/C